MSCAVCWLPSTVFSQLLRAVSRCLQVSGPGEGWPSPPLRASSHRRGVCRAASPLAAQLGQVGSRALSGSFLSSFPSRAGRGPLLHPPPRQCRLGCSRSPAMRPSPQQVTGAACCLSFQAGESSALVGVESHVRCRDMGRHPTAPAVSCSCQVGASLSPSHTEWDARDSPPTLGGSLWLWSCPPRVRLFVLQH